MWQSTAFAILSGSLIVLLPVSALGLGLPSAAAPAIAKVTPQTVFNTAFKLLQAQQYAAALRLLTPAYERVAREGNRRFELAFLNSIGTAELGLHRNRAAIATLTKAAELAAELKRPDTAAAIAINLSNVYGRLGQLDLAFTEAMKAFEHLPATAPANHRVQLLLNIAELREEAGERAAALAAGRSALDEGRRSGDRLLTADAEVRFASLLLRTGDWTEAERLLVHAIDFESGSGGHGLDVAYRNLGKLRIAQHRPKDALPLFEKSIALFKQGRSRLDGWHLYYDRGRARRLSGDLDGAFRDFSKSLSYARRWRTHIVPVDEVLSTSDMVVDEVVSALIETGMERYGKLNSGALAARLFAACEENRALSLRQNRGWLSRLPDRYWELLAHARKLETDALSRGTGARPEELRKAWAAIAKLETQSGLATRVDVGVEGAETALTSLRRHLRRDEALISFYVGNTQSYVWALTSNSFEVHAVGKRERVVSLSKAFTHAVMNGADDSRLAGIPLHKALFGALSDRVRQASSWILSLDDVLFTVPFAALPVESEFLIERRVLRIAPSAFVLTAARDLPLRPTFLALADPIYNRSDPRMETSSYVLASSNPSPAGIFRSETVQRSGSPLELPRIPGSGREAQACARSWAAGTATVLTGKNSRRTQLTAQLAQHPAVLHLSLHVVPSSTRRDAEAYIALGLGADGRPDFLTPSEIARFRYSVPVVIMSGCGSGRGQALRGAGLTGLTRAWLLAGSRAVAASLWPTPDDTGSMFRAFYAYLSASEKKLSARYCAQALRLAQIEMLRSGNWRAQPQYWAAFFLMAKD